VGVLGVNISMPSFVLLKRSVLLRAELLCVGRALGEVDGWGVNSWSPQPLPTFEGRNLGEMDAGSMPGLGVAPFPSWRCPCFPTMGSEPLAAGLCPSAL